jgi:hypothetical protein
MGARTPEISAEELPKGVRRRGGSYCINVLDAAGRRVRRSFGGDRDGAIAEVPRLTAEREQLREAGLTSIDQLVQNWLVRHELRSRPNTLRKVRAAARRVLAEFGGMDATKLTEQRRQAYVARR